MSAKTSDWRPGPTVCRCCLSEGCYKDISTEYFWMGKREVYAEMLSDTLDLSIAYSKSGPNSNSRLICEPCISRLRDAHDFKRQVLECEKTFMQHLDPGSESVQKEMELSFEEVKLERVKQEKKVSDDEDMDDQVDFVVNDDSDDDLDNEPLMKLATKVPKKEKEVDLLDLLDSSQITVKRKSTASTSKAKEPPAKKAKKREITIKPSASKATASKAVEKKKKDYDPMRSNAETLLRGTTAYPFRVNDKSAVVCVYCYRLYEEPDLFRAHMEQEHKECTIKAVFHNLPKAEIVKADHTDLRCRMCSENLNDLDAAAAHLNSYHKHEIDTNVKFGVMPYRLRKDAFICAVCEKVVPSLRHLNRHTITHFLSFVCHFCGSSYNSNTGLSRHLRLKHQETEVWCRTCHKKFPNMETKERHRRTEKSCMPYACRRCSERFLNWKWRERHMELKHGVTKKAYRCGDCDIHFTCEKSYYSHFKLQHSDNCVVCKHCGMKFVSTYRLKRHLPKHNI